MRLLLLFLLLAPLQVLSHDGNGDIVIYMTDAGFQPAEITVESETHVIFKNSSSRSFWPASNIHPTHSVYPNSDIEKCGTAEEGAMFDACRDIEPGNEYDFRFMEPGTWQYHDHISGTMGGSVTVRGSTSTEPVAEAGRLLQIFVEDIKVFTQKTQFFFCGSCRERALASFNINNALSDKNILRFSMKLFGPEEMKRQLVGDSPQLNFNGEVREVCHVDAHAIGKMEYQLYGKKIFNGAFDTRCQLGFFHGGIESYIGDLTGGDFAEEFEADCVESRDSTRRAQCEHALGHGLTVYYNYDLPAALVACDALPTDGAQKRCYHGVFMENAFTLFNISARDHVSVWVDSQKPDFPCDSPLITQNASKLSMCYNTQSLVWARPITPDSYNVSQAMEGCTRTPESMRGLCYQGVGFGMTVLPSIHGDGAVTQACREAPGKEAQLACLAGAVMARNVHWNLNYVEQQESFCALFDSADVDGCRTQTDDVLKWVYEP